MSGNKILDRPILPLKARKAVFEKLEDIADVASMSPEDRERYDNSVKVYRDYQVTMDAAEQKGMKEGAQKAQLQIARNMKAKGIDNQSIAECTDLPLSMTEELQSNQTKEVKSTHQSTISHPLLQIYLLFLRSNNIITFQNRYLGHSSKGDINYGKQFKKTERSFIGC